MDSPKVQKKNPGAISPSVSSEIPPEIRSRISQGISAGMTLRNLLELFQNYFSISPKSSFPNSSSNIWWNYLGNPL